MEIPLKNIMRFSDLRHVIAYYAKIQFLSECG
jgi:hypothetical protein